MSENNNKKKKSKGQKTSRNIIILLSVLLAIIIAAVVVIYVMISKYAHKFNYQKDEDVISTSIAKEEASAIVQEGIDEVIEKLTREDGQLLSESEKESISQELESIHESQASQVAQIELSKVDGVYNILLIGIDTRIGSTPWNGNSDSMILCTINHNKNAIYLTSFMRDTYVNFNGQGSKLNRAHAVGAGPALVQTIEDNFRIDIDYYATVNFNSMINIIDLLGGIDLEIRQEEVSVANIYVNQMCKGLGLNPADYALSVGGVQHLNGMQAVSYARIRYIGSDYERTERQRKVLTQVFGKLQRSDLGTINNFLNNSLPWITTNMPADFILSLINNAPTYLTYDFQAGFRVPFDAVGWTSYNEMLVTDFAATHNVLCSYMY